jgi:hypothetical protein
MTRFLTLLAVAAIAGVMYVAAAPGGLRSSGPTAKQFKALSKKVTKLQKQVTNLKKEADASLGIEALCIMHAPVGVDQVGTSSNGYLFGPPAPPATAATATSALNLAPSTEASPQHKLFALNTSQQACVDVANVTSTQAAARAVATLAVGH